LDLRVNRVKRETEVSLGPRALLVLRENRYL
jgi:hypothetical protein